MLAMSANHTEIVIIVDESRTKIYKYVYGNIGKPDLPYGVPGEPQRVEGARSNTPPTAFCFESYVVNTGEPGRDVKEGGEEASESPTKLRSRPGSQIGHRSPSAGKPRTWRRP